MKNKLFFAIVLFVVLAFATIVRALPTVEQVKINGDVFESGDSLVVEKGDTIKIRVKLQAAQDEKNIQVLADIVGYEYSTKEKLSDLTPVFDLNANDTVYKDLELKIPDKADKDYYDLRIRVATRTGTAFEGLYRLHIIGARHNVVIKDVIFTPESKIVSGRALLTVVRVKNTGELDEDGIKIRVSIPELGLSAADYIDELEAGESTSSEELYLRIPQCTKSGNYNVKVELIYNEGYADVTQSYSIYVEEEESCKPISIPPTVVEKTVITSSQEVQEVFVGGQGAVYPITITNLGTTAQTYVISVDAPWASVKVSPSNVLVIGAGETKTAYIYVTPNPTASVGEQIFTAKIMVGDQEKIVTMKAMVKKAVATDNLRKGLEIALIVLLVILIIVGIIVGLSKIKGSEEHEEERTQTYY